jgi:hypothetical protein
MSACPLRGVQEVTLCVTRSADATVRRTLCYHTGVSLCVAGGGF